jgi:hypothetical protein
LDEARSRAEANGDANGVSNGETDRGVDKEAANLAETPVEVTLPRGHVTNHVTIGVGRLPAVR